MTDDFSALENKVYSGRGLTLGVTPSEHTFIGYTLTGRSPPSQARKLVRSENTGMILTDVTDPEQLNKGSPALLIYPALAHADDDLIGSNGAQTMLIYSMAMHDLMERGGKPLKEPWIPNPGGLLSRAFERPCFQYDAHEDRVIDITTYEPDPNSTPRISACMSKQSGGLHIVWSDNGKKQSKVHPRFPQRLGPGEGLTITTYNGGNEKPLLLPFQGEPLEATVESETAQDIAESLYAAIHGGEPGENYRVAVAVMLKKAGTGEIETAIINRFDRGD